MPSSETRNDLTANLAADYGSFRQPEMRFTVSLRGFPPGDLSVLDYIQIHYPFLRMSQIDSVFAFHERFTHLYGGRSFDAAAVVSRYKSKKDNWLRDGSMLEV